ncbi:MAG: right-handed parallel beta-helix repeat-containing protein [Armatimonadota bacterium]|nr:right-handed parallel beta-helix repeat-containing protein [bacterium]
MALIVNHTTNGGVVTVTITRNGSPINAEIRWFSNGIWRPAPNGVASIDFPEMEQILPQGQRPTQFSITARSANPVDVTAAPVLVDIPAGGNTASITPSARYNNVVSVGPGGDFVGLQTADDYLAVSASASNPGGIQIRPGIYTEAFVGSDHIIPRAMIDGTVTIDGDVTIPASAGADYLLGCRITVGHIVTWGERSYTATKTGRIDEIINVLQSNVISARKGQDLQATVDKIAAAAGWASGNVSGVSTYNLLKIVFEGGLPLVGAKIDLGAPYHKYQFVDTSHAETATPESGYIAVDLNVDGNHNALGQESACAYILWWYINGDAAHNIVANDPAIGATEPATDANGRKYIGITTCTRLVHQLYSSSPYVTFATEIADSDTPQSGYTNATIPDPMTLNLEPGGYTGDVVLPVGQLNIIANGTVVIDGDVTAAQYLDADGVVQSSVITLSGDVIITGAQRGNIVQYDDYPAHVSRVVVDGVLRAVVTRDSQGVVREAELWADPAVTDHSSPLTPGSIQWAHNQLSSQGGRIVLNPGLYPTHKTIYLDRDWLTISGKTKSHWSRWLATYTNSASAVAVVGNPGGAQILTDQAIQLIRIHNSKLMCNADSRHKGIAFRDLYLYGSNVATCGISDSVNSDICEIDNCTFQGFQVEALHVCWDAGLITRNNIQGNNGKGVVLTGATTVCLVSHNVIADNGDDGITISPTHVNYTQGATIIDNTIVRCDPASNGIGINLIGGYNHIVDCNRITGCPGGGIVGANGDANAVNHVSNNFTEDNTGSPEGSGAGYSQTLLIATFGIASGHYGGWSAIYRDTANNKYYRVMSNRTEYYSVEITAPA